MAFFDASCPKCGKRFGWSGEIKDRPACPRCNYKPDLAELIKDQEKFEQMKKELFGKE